MKTCYYCKGPLRRRRVEHMHRWGDRRFLIRNLSAEVCAQCGETFLYPRALREIDELVRDGKPEGRVSVPVYQARGRAA